MLVTHLSHQYLLIILLIFSPFFFSPFVEKCNGPSLVQGYFQQLVLPRGTAYIMGNNREMAYDLTSQILFRGNFGVQQQQCQKLCLAKKFLM
jgi:hypothetical protein